MTELEGENSIDNLREGGKYVYLNRNREWVGEE